MRLQEEPKRAPRILAPGVVSNHEVFFLSRAATQIHRSFNNCIPAGILSMKAANSTYLICTYFYILIWMSAASSVYWRTTKKLQNSWRRLWSVLVQNGYLLHNENNQIQMYPWWCWIPMPMDTSALGASWVCATRARGRGARINCNWDR